MKSPFPREHVTSASPDLRAEQIELLMKSFPEVVTEGRIDFEKLRMLLGDTVDARPERYSFTWAGKRDAIRLAQQSSHATLVPAPEESVNFDGTQNLFIEGDNLEVLKLLHRAYFGRVKMIYIDPPYNTGNDFVYPDDYADPLDTYLELTRQKDANGNLLTSNPETSGRYHSAWLSMMYPRLVLARSFLREDGAIFVSIDDHEVYHLRMLMNEVFGEENFVSAATWRKKVVRGRGDTHVIPQTEYILIYARDLSKLPPFSEPLTPEMVAEYDLQDARGPYKLIPLAKSGTSQSPRPNLVYRIPAPDDTMIDCPTHQWRWSKETLEQNRDDIEFRKGRDGRWTVFTKQRLFVDGAERERTPTSYYDRVTTTDGTEEIKDLFGSVVIDFPKPSVLIRDLATWGTPLSSNQKDIIMDFFAGSCTTAQAVLELNRDDGGNRLFVMVQLPEPTPKNSTARNAGYATVAEIGKERIRRAITKLKQEDEGKLDLSTREMPEDLGFRVYKLAPSNLRQWPAIEGRDPQMYLQQLELVADQVLSGSQPGHVVWEAAICEGYGLTSLIERVFSVTRNSVYSVSDPEKGQRFHICLDDRVELDTPRALGLTQDDLFICRDSALDDSTAANLALQCRLKTL